MYFSVDLIEFFFIVIALEYLFAKATSMQCVEIDAPAHIHKLIIGKKAAYIRELQDTYKQVCLIDDDLGDGIRKSMIFQWTCLLVTVPRGIHQRQ